MSDRTPTPRDFPVMWTMGQARKAFPRRTFQPCPVCSFAIDPRNRARHAKACARRKRLAPELWAEWREDMRKAGGSRCMVTFGYNGSERTCAKTFGHDGSHEGPLIGSYAQRQLVRRHVT